MDNFIYSYISGLRRRILLGSLIIASVWNIADAQKISINNTTLNVLEYDADKSTGLDKIYVAYDLTNATINYRSDNPYTVKWFRYSNLGGAFAEELSTIEVENGSSILKNPKGDYGYIIEDNDTRYYFWLVEYKDKRFQINSIEEAPVQDCDYTIINIDGFGSPIHYFTINGQQRTLSREIELMYETQEWEPDATEYIQETKTKLLESLSSEISLNPPAYCTSYVRIFGDRFLKAWNWEQTKESNVFAPYSVAVSTSAKQESSESEDSNQIKAEGTGLGGSAPAQILFTAYTTEGVLHDEWQMSRSPEFSDIEYRFSVKDLEYTFTDEGVYYLRYIGSNSDGSCEAISDTYTVSIGASELLCPNAFSPDGDGVNDEWKVSYRSLLEFKCWIFDRAGHQLAYFDNPEQGWDGKKGGKAVGTGAYYYVIQALGSDGKKYKLNGDINIIRHKKINTESSPTTP